MFSIVIIVCTVIAFLLTIGSVCIFQEQESLEGEDLLEEEDFDTRSLKNIDMMIRGGYYCLLSFEYIKKGKESEVSGPIGAEYPDRKDRDHHFENYR